MMCFLLIKPEYNKGLLHLRYQVHGKAISGDKTKICTSNNPCHTKLMNWTEKNMDLIQYKWK